MNYKHTEDDQATVLSSIDGRPADRPLVSVIIPAYNAASFIHRAIESALAQTHHSLEIVVVDDGSTDATAEAVRLYPVTLIRQPNGGPGSARNAGVRVSRGEWLAFLDHDDTWLPNKNEVQLALAGPGIDAVFSPKHATRQEPSFEDMFWRNLGGNPSSTIIRREALYALGLFDEDQAVIGVEDYNLWLRFILAGRRFALSPLLYNFSPAPNHFSGRPDKMLAAELVNIDKISTLAGISEEVRRRRRRDVRLRYMSWLIHDRWLVAARHHLCCVGLNQAAIRHWYAFLPRWLLDLRRRLRARRVTRASLPSRRQLTASSIRATDDEG